MRMPFIEFITQGDVKFVILFIGLLVFAFYHFIKKIKHKNKEEYEKVINYHNVKIKHAAHWILIASVLSLLLGLMHSFYFIGKGGGIAPHLIFQGVSYALITPVLGVSLFIICKFLTQIFNPNITNS